MSSAALVLELTGAKTPETLRTIRQLWARQDVSGPFEGMFLNQYLEDLYADVLRQTTIFSAFSTVAVLIAALGLLGLAVFTAERRTKEIGLRKVMGASRLDILRFLGWQFARPVLWANLIAWPCAYFFMQRWLEGMWRSHRWTVLLITHDVREAVLLSDRIYALSARPARVVSEIAVPLPRPRTQSAALAREAAAIEAGILDTLLGLADPNFRSSDGGLK